MCGWDVYASGSLLGVCRGADVRELRLYMKGLDGVVPVDTISAMTALWAFVRIYGNEVMFVCHRIGGNDLERDYVEENE